MIKAIDNKKLFTIAHSKTKNFKAGYKDVNYSVQLSIFLKEVYKLKKIIENKIRKTFVNGFKLKYLLSHPVLDADIKKILKEIYNFISAKLNEENKIKNFDKYIAPNECQQLSLF